MACPPDADTRTTGSRHITCGHVSDRFGDLSPKSPEILAIESRLTFIAEWMHAHSPDSGKLLKKEARWAKLVNGSFSVRVTTCHSSVLQVPRE